GARAAAVADRVVEVEVAAVGRVPGPGGVAEVARREREADQPHQQVPGDRPELGLELLPGERLQDVRDGAVDARVVARIAGPATAGQDEGLAALEARADRAAVESDGAGLRGAPVGRVPDEGLAAERALGV